MGNGMNSVAKQLAVDGGQLRKSKETNPPLSSIVSNPSPFCELVALSVFLAPSTAPATLTGWTKDIC